MLNPADSASAFTQNLVPVSAAISITFLLFALAALLLPIDIAVRRLSSLEFLTLGLQWLLSHLGIRRPQAAMQTAQPSRAPVIAPLGSIRAKRQERRDRITPTGQAVAPRFIVGVTPTTPQAKSASPARETRSAQQQEESGTSTPATSTAETLLAAKRKRQQQGKQPEE